MYIVQYLMMIVHFLKRWILQMVILFSMNYLCRIIIQYMFELGYGLVWCFLKDLHQELVFFAIISPCRETYGNLNTQCFIPANFFNKTSVIFLNEVALLVHDWLFSFSLLSMTYLWHFYSHSNCFPLNISIQFILWLQLITFLK